MKTIILRPYQKECIELIENLQPGAYVLQLPTGTGKTVIFSHIKRHGKILIISHRDELVKQPIKYFDCPCGIEQGRVHSHGEEIISASVMTLHRRLQKFDPEEFDIIITDECHHAAAKTYRKIYDYFTPRLHLGFTATPNRGDRVRLDDIYKDIVFQKDILWAIGENYLCDINCIRVNIGYDIRQVKIKRGDYDQIQLEAELNQKKANEGIAEAYKKLAVGQTLIFAVSVEHANSIAREIPGAVVVTATTQNRSEILHKFETKEIKCIVNVMLFTEGTDLPSVETIIMARPTRNSTLYTQIVGRGLRPYPGKSFLTLIDCVGSAEMNDLCTAPSLLGIDISQVPENKRQYAIGKLTEMQKTITQLIDKSPEAWILNCRQLDLFFKKNEYNPYGVRYTLAVDGSMICSLKNHVTVRITAPDTLGRSRCLYYREYPKSQRFYRSSQEMPLQNILRTVRDFLEKNHPNERYLWDATESKAWRKQPISPKQKALIQSLKAMPINRQYDFNNLDIDQLNKEDASIIIDRLKTVRLI